MLHKFFYYFRWILLIRISLISMISSDSQLLIKHYNLPNFDYKYIIKPKLDLKTTFCRIKNLISKVEEIQETRLMLQQLIILA
jgi:hypothetical protein